MTRSLGVLLLVASCATVALVLRERRAGFTWREVLRVHGLVAMATIIGAASYGLVERGWYVLTEPGVHLLRQARLPGAFLGLALVTPLLARWLPPTVGLPAYGDLLAPVLAFSFAAVRLSCLLAGCCFGVVTSLPWGIRYPRDSLAMRLHVAEGKVAYAAAWSLPVHPLQLYFAALAIAVGCVVLWYRRRQRYDGELLLLFVVLHETGKGLLELLRPAALGGRHLVANSLVVGAAAAIALTALRGRRTSLRPAAGPRRAAADRP